MEACGGPPLKYINVVCVVAALDVLRHLLQVILFSPSENVLLAL